MSHMFLVWGNTKKILMRNAENDIIVTYIMIIPITLHVWWIYVLFSWINQYNFPHILLTHTDFLMYIYIIILMFVMVKMVEALKKLLILWYNLYIKNNYMTNSRNTKPTKFKAIMINYYSLEVTFSKIS
jgi:hypothetical protein